MCPAGAHTCSGRCRGCQRGLGPSLPSRRASRPLTLRSALRAQGDRTACARLPPAPSSLILPPSPDAERHIRKCSNDSACILRISCTGAIAGHRERLRSPQCRAATTSDETQPGRAPRQRVGEPSEHLCGLENPPVLPPSLWGSEQIPTPRGKPCSERLRTGLRKRTALGSSRSPDEHPL